VVSQDGYVLYKHKKINQEYHRLHQYLMMMAEVEKIINQSKIPV